MLFNSIQFGEFLGCWCSAIIAAAAQQYPLRGRLALWLLPAALLAVAAGAEWIGAGANFLHPIVGAIFVIALLVPPVMALAEAPPPYEIEHRKDLLGYLQKNRRPGDVVYVFPFPPSESDFTARASDCSAAIG